MSTPLLQQIHGDARKLPLPDTSVHCVVTSPPYYGLRDYGTDPLTWGGDLECAHSFLATTIIPKNRNGHISKHSTDTETERAKGGEACTLCGAWRGHLGGEALHDCLGWARREEPCPACFVCHLRTVAREMWRVLRADGTLWLNLGDSYANDTKWGGASGGKHVAGLHGNTGVGRSRRQTGLKPKDLIGIPWRVALALQADGWTLRNDIIWHKLAPMPGSQRDRCTSAHEHVFLLTKRARYYFDEYAIREPSVSDHGSGNGFKRAERLSTLEADGTPRGNDEPWQPTATRTCRDVWTLGPEQCAEAHFAVMPGELARRCIRAGTSEKGCCEKCGAPWERTFERTQVVRADFKGSRSDTGKTYERDGGDRTQPGDRYERAPTGWAPTCRCNAGVVPCVVLDPFGGSGTVGKVALEEGRRAILNDLNPEYLRIQDKRTRDVQLPLLAGVA